MYCHQGIQTETQEHCTFEQHVFKDASMCADEFRIKRTGNFRNECFLVLALERIVQGLNCALCAQVPHIATSPAVLMTTSVW